MPSRPLIPRKLLFDNPVAMGGKISPDGRFITWLAPCDGVLNIWIAPSDDLRSGEALTRTKGRPIVWHVWSTDSRYVIFGKNETGDENDHLFAVDWATRELRDLTPIPGVSAQLLLYSRDVPDRILVGLNDRDARWHDQYEINIATGARKLLWENTQDLLKVGFDWSYEPRYAIKSAADGGSDMVWIKGNKLEPWTHVGFEDNWSTRPIIFDHTNTRLLMCTSIGRETAQFAWVDCTSGQEETLVAHPRFDVGGFVLNPMTFEMEAASISGVKQEWIYVAPHLCADFDVLQRELTGFRFYVSEMTDDGRRWIVDADRPQQPSTTFLFDRDRQTVTELFRARPALNAYRLAPMRAIEQTSRDGLNLVSYLTMPADISGDKPASPLPMVLLVHGGPWSRDSYGYVREHQWLANRGYAVLSVNYRGSTGFGKSFVAASEKQHAARMHDDLIDMVEWAIREGIADKSRIAIHGGSYGGLASFIGATFTPDVFCCSIPVVGITNLQTLLESMPPYWAGFAEYMYRSYGDPRTEEGRKLLAERSPIHKVDNIRVPMLILHGANDVRCKIAESDTIVAAMKAKGIPVTYVVYPDEGHGFAKPGNRIASYAITEAFLAHCMGGDCEAMGDDLEGSSHEIRAGAELLARLGAGAAQRG